MVFYVLDSNFDRIALVETFESMIWTERYTRCGDFQMTIENDSEISKLLVPGTYLANSESDRLMIPETRSLGTDTAEGLVEISGRSLEFLIERRPTSPMLNQEDFYAGNAAYIVMNAVRWACVQNEWGVPLPNALPNFRVSYVNVPPTEPFASKPKKSSVYDYVLSVSEIVNLGFKVTVGTYLNLSPYNGGMPWPPENGPLPEPNMMIFETFVGADRTSKQKVNPLVAFRPDLENLSNSQYLESTLGYKNVANVWGDDNKYCMYDVVPAGVNLIDIPPQEQRWLVVDANDIQRPALEEDFRKLLLARGLAALSQYPRIKIFDGEVYEKNSYIYNRDYFIGDIVELADVYGHKGAARVTEYIWAQDSSGIRAYPTFTSIG